MSSEGKYLSTDYRNFFETKLSEIDPEISKAIDDELIRQQNHIELIASEIASVHIKLSSPISTGLGTPPAMTIDDAVAIKVCEEQITSSPGLSPIDCQIISSPSVQFPTPIA